jgi:hypothetical protein
MNRQQAKEMTLEVFAWLKARGIFPGETPHERYERRFEEVLIETLVKLWNKEHPNEPAAG